MVPVHDGGYIAQGCLDGVDGIANQSLAECNKEQGFAVRCTFAVWVVHAVDEGRRISRLVAPTGAASAFASTLPGGRLVRASALVLMMLKSHTQIMIRCKWSWSCPFSPDRLLFCQRS